MGKVLSGVRCAYGPSELRGPVLDHAPCGETTPFENKEQRGMNIVMSMGDVLGISQLALRSAETIRCGE